MNIFRSLRKRFGNVGNQNGAINLFAEAVAVSALPIFVVALIDACALGYAFYYGNVTPLVVVYTVVFVALTALWVTSFITNNDYLAAVGVAASLLIAPLGWAGGYLNHDNNMQIGIIMAVGLLGSLGLAVGAIVTVPAMCFKLMQKPKTPQM